MVKSNNKSKKLLFVTSANLTSNPRLLKELRYAVEQKHEVSFLGFRLGNWSDEIDKQIVKEINADFVYLSAMRKPFIKWLLSTIYERFSKLVFAIFTQNIKIAALSDKRSLLLYDYLKKHSKTYDIIISHTLQTLYPTYKFAQNNNLKFTFDIEDYHVGETCTNEEKRIRTLLMNKLLPKADWITYASPLIGKYSLELCNYKVKNHTLINNCFPSDEFQFKANNSDKVKFVWFSQNISFGRGLEQILPTINEFKNNVELHLIGNLYPKFYNNILLKYKNLIVIHKPMSQHELNKTLSEFDIGLAIEQGKDLNNEILWSNKIWSYMQAGLYILTSKTDGQVQFLNQHKKCGVLYDKSEQELQLIVEKIISNKDKIRQDKLKRYQYAKQYSWDKEKIKLKNTIFSI